MGLEDRSTNGEPQSHAFRLGSKHRVSVVRFAGKSI
jgi:hypothetical protein